MGGLNDALDGCIFSLIGQESNMRKEIISQPGKRICSSIVRLGVVKNTRRKLAEILATDVVGYCRTKGGEEGETLNHPWTLREYASEPRNGDQPWPNEVLIAPPKNRNPIRKAC
jgi:hypothetical protein